MTVSDAELEKIITYTEGNGQYTLLEEKDGKVLDTVIPVSLLARELLSLRAEVKEWKEDSERLAQELKRINDWDLVSVSVEDQYLWTNMVDAHSALVEKYSATRGKAGEK